MGTAPVPDAIIGQLRELADPNERAKIAKRIPLDQVIGVRMKHVFDLAKAHSSMELDEVRALIRSHWYEARLFAVCVLDFRARSRKITDDERRALFEFYLTEHEHINSWDLVDRAAPRVIGSYLLGRSHDPLVELAKSTNLWERRTAITAAFQLIRAGELETPLRLVDLLLDDHEHFVQTSVGVALRELRRAAPVEGAEFVSANASRISPTTRRLMADRR